MARAYLRRIATAAPDHDIHEKFVVFAADMLSDTRTRSIFQRLAAKSGIHHRYSCLQEKPAQEQMECDAFSFYGNVRDPSTSERMKVFERFAPMLLRKTLNKLSLNADERQSIRHVLVTCCTGFYAPGLDFDIIRYLGLSQATERTMLGFMGCYAAINALKLARHIVRSDPDSTVLMVNLELCTLHFHQTQDLTEAIAFTLFGDGCAASLVSAAPGGLELDGFHAIQIENTHDLITWRVGDLGFNMFLSTHVPSRIEKALRENAETVTDRGGIRLWAVHPGGRSILDAVESGLALPHDALRFSRDILSSFGNMSSASIMFVLERLMQQSESAERGCAISFGPGLTAEIMRFHAV